MNRITRSNILRKKYSAINKDNVGPKVWGKYGWFLFHSIINHYPIKPTTSDEINIKKFVDNFSKVLPCDKCRTHFKSNLSKCPLTHNALSSRQHLLKWSCDIHNEANRSLYKEKKSFDAFMLNLRKEDTKTNFELYVGKFIEYVIKSYPNYLSISERNNFLNFIVNLNKVYPSVYLNGNFKKRISKPLTPDIIGSKSKLETWFK